MIARSAAVTSPCRRDELWTIVDRFAKWLEASGYASYDPYDVWATRYGKCARRLYYRKSLLGMAMAAPVVVMEVLCPRVRALFVERDRYPTADAQLALAFINLHELSQRIDGVPGPVSSRRRES